MNKLTIIDILTCYAFSALPIIWFAFIVLYMRMNKKKFYKWEKEEYPHVDNHVQSIYWKSDYNGIYVSVSVSVWFLIMGVWILNSIFSHYISGMMKNLEVVANISVDLTGFAFAMAVAIFVFKKKYYIIFSVKDVLREFNFLFWMKWSIISCFCTCVMTMTLLDGEVITEFDKLRIIAFEMMVICNLVCNIMAYSIVWKIMFSDKKVELKLLKKLYRVHEIGNMDCSQMKKGDKWKKEAVEDHIDFLFEDYKCQCKKVKTTHIKNIELVFTPENKRETWNKQVRNRYWGLVIICVMLGLMINTNLCICYKEDIKNYWILHLVIGIVELSLIYWPIKNLKDIVFTVIWEKWGFCFNTGKDRFITCRSYQIFNKKYVHYLQSFGSLTGFVKVASEKMFCTKQNVRITQEILEKNILDLSRDISDVVGMMPIFIVGYIQFINGSRMECVKDVFQKINLNEESVSCFKEMFYDYILYMDKDKADRNAENRYLKWLCN